MTDDIQLQMNEDLPLRDVVFQTLRQAILRGTLQPGERLMEIHLAQKLGVSRTPVREAIRYASAGRTGNDGAKTGSCGGGDHDLRSGRCSGGESGFGRAGSPQGVSEHDVGAADEAEGDSRTLCRMSEKR